MLQHWQAFISLCNNVILLELATRKLEENNMLEDYKQHGVHFFLRKKESAMLALQQNRA